MMKTLELLFLFLMLTSSSPVWGEELHSQCQEKKVHEDFFSAHTLALTLCSNNEMVCFVSDGSFGLYEENGMRTQFNVGVGGSFEQSPDRHGKTNFRLQKIQQDGIVIQYEASFNHSAFVGKELITVDTCDIKIPYIAPREITEIMPIRELAYYYVGKKDYPKAIDAFKKAIKNDPVNAVFDYEGLGDAFLEVGNVQEAIDCYEKSISLRVVLKRSTKKVYYKLGGVYLMSGEYQKAKDNFLKAKETI